MNVDEHLGSASLSLSHLIRVLPSAFPPGSTLPPHLAQIAAMLQNLQWGLAPMQVRTTDADDSDGDSTVFVIPNGGPLLRVPECIRRRHEQDEIINLVSSDEEEEDKPPPKKIRRLLRGKLNVPSPSSEPFPLVHIDKGTRLPNRRDTAGVFDRRDSGKGLTAEKEHNPPQQRLNYTVSKIGESLEKELSTSTNTVECGGRDGSPDHDLDTLDEVAIVPRVPTAGQRNVFEHLPSEVRSLLAQILRNYSLR